MYTIEEIEKAYDYINRVTEKQGRLLDRETLYGDGSIYNFDRSLFDTVYDMFKELIGNI